MVLIYNVWKNNDYEHRLFIWLIAFLCNGDIEKGGQALFVVLAQTKSSTNIAYTQYELGQAKLALQGVVILGPMVIHPSTIINEGRCLTSVFWCKPVHSTCHYVNNNNKKHL
uniref:Uncharacterized protein n=1 Tax=Cacopsylla melanoneura TaxID=428564 RepID=A0A8D9ECW4_9HEMI